MGPGSIHRLQSLRREENELGVVTKMLGAWVLSLIDLVTTGL